MNKKSTPRKPLVVLAFSGGLDTSFCALWLQKELGAEVVTATVQTGGFGAKEVSDIRARALSLGAKAHHLLEGRDRVYERFVSTLIRGNVLRGRVYPLSVAAERVVQAEMTASLARELGAQGLCHGSTGAGNDQFRFDGAFRALAPELSVHTPVRDMGLSREQETEYLSSRGHSVPAKTAAYSVNAGLWGTTIGGKETHDPWTEVPEAAFPSAGPLPAGPRDLILGFSKGLPVSLDGKALEGPALVEKLNLIGRSFRIGRGIHVGDTVCGIKGRVAFEAPAPLLLITAHRELEKLVLTGKQAFYKDQAAEYYGQLLHEGLAFDPAMEDLEALIISSQKRVDGEARLRLREGGFEVTGVRSPFSLMNAGATYGEGSSLWTGTEAAGFAKLHALPMVLARRMAKR